MTDGELIMEMRQAKNPYEQVQILADMCCVTREEMEERLLSLGVELPEKRRVGRKPGPKPKDQKPALEKPAKAPAVTLSRVEAEALYNHLMFSILDEIKADPETYDSVDYLVNLVHVYERCKEVSKC